MDYLEGTVERVTFFNPENGYSVIRLKPARAADLVTLVGNLPELTPGAAAPVGARKSDRKGVRLLTLRSDFTLGDKLIVVGFVQQLPDVVGRPGLLEKLTERVVA